MPKRTVMIDAVRWGGPLPGVMRVPTIDDEPPSHVDVVVGEAVARYKRTAEADEQGRVVYRPAPELTFRWEDPPQAG